jgi:hypothetical protein
MDCNELHCHVKLRDCCLRGQTGRSSDTAMGLHGGTRKGLEILRDETMGGAGGEFTTGSIIDMAVYGASQCFRLCRSPKVNGISTLS